MMIRDELSLVHKIRKILPINIFKKERKMFTNK